MDVYKKAIETVQKRRIRAINENEKRISEINRSIPQISVLNNKLFSTGKEIIKVMHSGLGREETEKQIDILRQDNLNTQKAVKCLLKKHGYPENYLDTPFFCPYCNDTGYAHGGFYCNCFKKLVKDFKTEEFNKNTSLKLVDFNSFRLDFYAGEEREKMSRILGYSRNYAENFSHCSENLLFMGGVGLGKTHLSLAIAKTVIGKGVNVVYNTSQNIIKKIVSESFSFDDSGDVQQDVEQADLLIIDDVGTEYDNKNYNAMFFNVVNARLNIQRPTILNTNLDFNGIAQRYGDRTASRLLASYRTLVFCGKDIRLQKRLK